MSRQSKRPSQLPRAVRPSGMALQSKSAGWLTNVLSMSAHVNWCGKRNLQMLKLNDTYLSSIKPQNMNTENQNGYMLLFRGTDLRKGLSPEELQKVTDNWMAWFKGLTEQGKAVAG